MNVELEEAERQLVLLALAHLAVERPGFDCALNHVALKLDNNVAGRAEMFDRFASIRRAEDLRFTFKNETDQPLQVTYSEFRDGLGRHPPDIVIRNPGDKNR